MNTSTEHLPITEWLIVCLFCLFLTLLGLLAYLQEPIKQKTTLTSPYQQSLLCIDVKGAVANPGIYQMPMGSYLADAISLANPLEEADLSFLKTNRQLNENQTLVVPLKKWLTIYIEGAVEAPGAFQVLSGTKIEDLLDYLVFKKEADLKCLRKKKRMLRDGETVQISYKQNKIRKSDPSFN